MDFYKPREEILLLSDSRSKEKKSSSTSKDASHSQHKSSGKSTHAKEPSHTVDDSGVQQDQEFDMGNNDEQPVDKEVSKDDCKPLPLIPDHQGRQVIPRDFFINNDLKYLKGGDLSRGYSTSVTKTKAATYEIKWIKTWSNLRNRTTYKAYSDPKGVIYKDQNNKNRLIRADELHKFSDGTLNDVRIALLDIAKGIRMEYLPKRKRSGLDKQRARVMVQDIDKQLYERRLMRNLEKFVGGREYENDLRLLERTI
ncbi:hypothetical protein Tco_0500167 [Tanacetum coccineum]